MVSFRAKFVQGLTDLGIGVVNDLADTPYAAILVIGGTKDLAGLWRAKRHGVKIVQRLDGMNWIHRQRRTGWRHFLRAEYGNIILSFIRSRLVDHVVYQSKFSQEWWERVYGIDQIPWHVVYNGVDLKRYNPDGEGKIPEDRKRILLVEGSIAGGYEWGLETAIQIAQTIQDTHHHPIELMVVGYVSETIQRDLGKQSNLKLNYVGRVPAEKIPEFDRSAHVLYAADINAACPNSVIEAMACGLPVAAFNTGAIPELVTNNSGELRPYGGDPWRLDVPDFGALAEAVARIIDNQMVYREGARKRAEEAFSVDLMVKGYLEALNL